MSGEAQWVEVKTTKLRTKSFSASLNKLMQMDRIPVEAMFRLRAVAKAVRSEVEDFEEVLKKLLDDAAARDEAGNPIIEKQPDGNDAVKIDSAKKDHFEQEYKVLVQKTSQLKALPVAKLGKALEFLRPDDLLQLEFIVE